MKTTSITQKIIIPTTPEEVYGAYMDAEKHAAFTGSDATSDPRVGGKFTAWDGYIFGRYLELEPGRRIVQEWKTTAWPDEYPPSRLELVLRKVPTGTELVMSHTGVPAEQADDYAQGWIDYYWEPMKAYFRKK
jgi:activator of HSP90 ATPase